MKKKCYSCSTIIICIFFFLYLILPNYFAFEFSESIPLLTASRILILLFILIVFFKSKGKITRRSYDKSFSIFIALMLSVNIVNILYLAIPSIKTVLSFVLEYLLLSYLIIRYVNTEEKINTAITAMVYASIVVGLLGAIETLTSVNIFYYLTTTKREMLQSQYIRFGLVRASGPFGHAVYYGNYCVCMIPFSLYLYDIKKKSIFFFAFLVNIISVIMSGSRASVILLLGILVYIFIKKSKKDTRKYFKNTLIIIPLVIIVFIVFPQLYEKGLSVIDSSLNAFTETSTDRSNSLVGNANPLLSRLEQWSGIIWTIQNGRTISGLGNNAHMEGLIYYLRDGIWTRSKTFDVGYVAVFCQYGIIGVIAYSILYWTRLKKTENYKKELKSCLKKDNYSIQTSRLLNLQTTFHIFYVGYLVHLLSSVGVEEMLVIVISLQIAANQICNQVLSEQINYDKTRNKVFSVQIQTTIADKGQMI